MNFNLADGASMVNGEWSMMKGRTLCGFISNGRQVEWSMVNGCTLCGLVSNGWQVDGRVL
ncbi:hypothetical protein [Niastella populi]|uniref:Uncharacterized protein n=1 Tax=Niastella populi TaxID=550983 RepID=A0A1V9EYM6_9BACT|nr:hypothetical protein [Niastella populi]OQP51192.1 hypothetical protein A4R26_29700 [Niastella populi]